MYLYGGSVEVEFLISTGLVDEPVRGLPQILGFLGTVPMSGVASILS